MNDLFLHVLQDIYYAEKQGLKTLARVSKNVEYQRLGEFVRDLRDQSQAHVESLEQVFATLGKRPRGKKCDAMDGLINEVNEAIGAGEQGTVLDAALIAGMQAMKHYEIARLGTLKAWAKELDNERGGELLAALVDEDEEADAQLSGLVEERTSPKASEHGDDEDEEDEEEDEDDDEEEGDEVDEEEEDEDEEEEDEAAAESVKSPRGRGAARA